MVVDDQRYALDVVTDILERHSGVVTAVATPEDGLESCSENVRTSC